MRERATSGQQGDRAALIEHCLKLVEEYVEGAGYLLDIRRCRGVPRARACSFSAQVGITQTRWLSI